MENRPDLASARPDRQKKPPAGHAGGFGKPVRRKQYRC